MRIHLKKEQKQLVSEHSDYFFNYFTLGMVRGAHTLSTAAQQERHLCAICHVYHWLTLHVGSSFLSLSPSPLPTPPPPL